MKMVKNIKKYQEYLFVKKRNIAKQKIREYEHRLAREE